MKADECSKMLENDELLKRVFLAVCTYTTTEVFYGDIKMPKPQAANYHETVIHISKTDVPEKSIVIIENSIKRLIDCKLIKFVLESETCNSENTLDSLNHEFQEEHKDDLSTMKIILTDGKNPLECSGISLYKEYVNKSEELEAFESLAAEMSNYTDKLKAPIINEMQILSERISEQERNFETSMQHGLLKNIELISVFSAMDWLH